MTLVGTLKNIAYIALFIILLPLIPLMIGGIHSSIIAILIRERK